jgi:A/G-specific adenine glycosylase/sugar fermentation stimulation protein
MEYKHIVEGRFMERPNRFIARVKINGRVETVHVKNTGRCRELLREGALVYLDKSSNPLRSTAYDLVAVEKDGRLINMDSQAPNAAVWEWLRSGKLFSDVILIRPETQYGNSRFDFYIETSTDKIFMEVKGVTLEEDGVVRFPDAPSDRAVKHMEELVAAKKEGYRAMVMFVVQMEGAKYFTPHRDMHPAFAQALLAAQRAGIEILAYDCQVTPREMTVNQPIPVVMHPKFAGISEPLLKWYDKNKRILPWRESPSPYHVWVSEIMLQQTRVEAVKSYYERFMGVLPDMEALADAEEELLLKLWEGLGYYNRVRNLQKAAIQIRQECGGKMPGTYEALMKLPGIGSYTAGAIASIAFGQAVPAVDGNVLRVAARLREDGRLITDPKVREAVERELKEIIPKDRPGDFNQAMMEIGACICIPNGVPLCHQCPFDGLCMAHASGRELEYPKKQGKKPRQIQEKTILVIQDANKAAIHKRDEKGLLAGMYELPSMEGFHTAEEVVEYLAENGLKVLRVQPLDDAKHIFTHIEWRMKGYMVRVDELAPKRTQAPLQDAGSWIYVDPEETKKKYPIPSAFTAYARYLGIRPGH